MKVEINKNPVRVFHPISLKFIIENQRELELFISLLNANGNDLAEFINSRIPVNKLQGKIEKFEGGECVSALKAKSTWDKLVEYYNNDQHF